MNAEEKKSDFENELNGAEKQVEDEAIDSNSEDGDQCDENAKTDEKCDTKEDIGIENSTTGNENDQTSTLKEGSINDKKVEEEPVEVELTKDEIDILIKKSSERDEFLDKLQRTRAEYLNFQKRKNKEIGDIRRYAVQDFATALTSVLDNFNLAIQFTKESKDFAKLLEGIELVEGQLYKTLEEHGVKPIETVGKPFDPLVHEAVIEEEDDSKPHHTVIMELQKGFLLHDRVIRPAKVKVSKKIEKEDEYHNESEVEGEKEEIKESEE